MILASQVELLGQESCDRRGLGDRYSINLKNWDLAKRCGWKYWNCLEQRLWPDYTYLIPKGDYHSIADLWGILERYLSYKQVEFYLMHIFQLKSIKLFVKRIFHFNYKNVLWHQSYEHHAIVFVNPARGYTLTSKGYVYPPFWLDWFRPNKQWDDILTFCKVA